MKEQGNNTGNNSSRKDNKVKLVNAKFSDAASENQRDTERVLEADKAATPSYELHTENESRRKATQQADLDDKPQQAQTGRARKADENETAKFGEERGGTTNLSIDQLKKERGIS